MILIRLKEFIEQTVFSHSVVYRKINEGVFLQSVSLGDRAVAWGESEVQDWIALSRIAHCIYELKGTMYNIVILITHSLMVG